MYQPFGRLLLPSVVLRLSRPVLGRQDGGGNGGDVLPVVVVHRPPLLRVPVVLSVVVGDVDHPGVGHGRPLCVVRFRVWCVEWEVGLLSTPVAVVPSAAGVTVPPISPGLLTLHPRTGASVPVVGHRSLRVATLLLLRPYLQLLSPAVLVERLPWRLPGHFQVTAEPTGFPLSLTVRVQAVSVQLLLPQTSTRSPRGPCQ